MNNVVMNTESDDQYYTLAQEGEFDDINELSNIKVSHKWEFYQEDPITIDNFSVGVPYQKLKKAMTLTPEAEYYLFNHSIKEVFILKLLSLVRDRFSEEEVVLSVYEDVEDEMEDQLNMTILTDKEPEKALALLDHFDDKTIELGFDLDNILVDIDYL